MYTGMKEVDGTRYYFHSWGGVYRNESFTWQGKKYRFAMNGQTGKFVGNLPTDKGAYVRWFVGLTAGISVAAFSILSLLWML